MRHRKWDGGVRNTPLNVQPETWACTWAPWLGWVQMNQPVSLLLPQDLPLPLHLQTQSLCLAYPRHNGLQTVCPEAQRGLWLSPCCALHLDSYCTPHPLCGALSHFLQRPCFLKGRCFQRLCLFHTSCIFLISSYDFFTPPPSPYWGLTQQHLYTELSCQLVTFWDGILLSP